ncbi:MAG: sodium:calcium antiporter, partial [Muribaculaceae bacterium]|nr:sodium:calcium antiporter [Muribaculaceae bacterium]
MMTYIWLIVGLALILIGANALTDGSSAIARRFGISDLVVGLTVVAFGTSAPELVISLISSVNGQAGLAIGNVLGSNVFNILAIIGVTAIIKPIKVERTVMTREMPMVVISSFVLLILGNSGWLDGSNETSVIGRAAGLLLL